MMICMLDATVTGMKPISVLAMAISITYTVAMVIALIVRRVIGGKTPALKMQ